ncbi:hypothetical protein Mapa_005517 [Marchantia paleacea]|nr:hypothetical protein Mapa_005517 [Marchantia paleacea]
MAVPKGKEAIVSSSARGNRLSFPPGSVRSAVKVLLVLCLVLLAAFVVVTYPLWGAGQVPNVLLGVSFGSWREDLARQQISKEIQVEEIGNSGSKSSLFNESFLAFAAIDPAEDNEKRKIRMILDGKVDDMQNAHNKWNYQRRMDHYVDLDQNRRRVRPRYEGWLLQLQNPKFAGSWFKFRQLLQSWSRYKHYDPLVMHELMQLVKKPIDQFYSDRNGGPVEEGKRYKTCAVVGNSGILLNRTFGDFIDSHDMVMRLNNAKLLGFEKHVGTKTTLSFVNSNIYHACSRRLKCFCHQYGEVPLLMYLCQVQHMMDVAYCAPSHKSPVLVTDPRLDNLCSRLVKWYSVKRYVEATGNSVKSWTKHHNLGDFHYSSGFQAIVLALGICDKVNILGFGKSPEAKHHYHTNQRGELDLHDYAAEYNFYDDLVHNRTPSIPFFNEVSDFIFPSVGIFL